MSGTGVVFLASFTFWFCQIMDFAPGVMREPVFFFFFPFPKTMFVLIRNKTLSPSSPQADSWVATQRYCSWIDLLAISYMHCLNALCLVILMQQVVRLPRSIPLTPTWRSCTASLSLTRKNTRISSTPWETWSTVWTGSSCFVFKRRCYDDSRVELAHFICCFFSSV